MARVVLECKDVVRIILGDLYRKGVGPQQVKFERVKNFHYQFTRTDDLSCKVTLVYDPVGGYLREPAQISVFCKVEDAASKLLDALVYPRSDAA